MRWHKRKSRPDVFNYVTTSCEWWNMDEKKLRETKDDFNRRLVEATKAAEGTKQAATESLASFAKSAEKKRDEIAKAASSTKQIVADSIKKSAENAKQSAHNTQSYLQDKKDAAGAYAQAQYLSDTQKAADKVKSIADGAQKYFQEKK